VDAKTALVTPSLPEGWTFEEEESYRWYFAKGASELNSYCIEDYTSTDKVPLFAFEYWDIRDTRWIAIERFPDFNTAYHFAVMYILTQE
jgi:hypothetical protein